ncbi:MAG: hypothetical protein KAR38_00815, partial [Calditrichia bacterium]|nr:hypothetical protein [Calditrichia bacterium]
MNIVIFLKNKMFLVFTALLFLFISMEALALDPAFSLKNYQLSLYDINSGLPHNTIQTLLQSKNGYIWIGTPSGLVRFDGVHFKLFNSINTPTLKNDNIISLHEDHDEALWIGTDGGGLYSYKNGKWKNYTRKEGLSNNHINSITSDWQGTLWIGTNYGLNSLNNNGIKQYTTEDGLYDNIITALTIDLQGNLWVGTLRGSLAQF